MTALRPAPQFPAVLTGLALGDALGAPWEPRPEDPQDVNPPGLDTWAGEMVDGHLGPAGTTTDDTGMAEALARSMVEGDPRGYDRDRAARAYLAWYDVEKKSRGIGGTIRRSLEQYRATGTLFAPPHPEGRVGNGTAMRVAPLGLRYWRDTAALLEHVAADARFTHNSPEAAAGSAAVALAVAYGVDASEDPDPVFIPFHCFLRIRKELRPDYRNTRVWWALSGITEVAANYPYKTTEEEYASWCVIHAQEVGVDGDVAATVYTALLAASIPRGSEEDPVERARNHFRRCVRLAVRMGGDTDTRAAITGAIIGALVRQEGLPPEWLKELKNRGGKFLTLDKTLYEDSFR